MTNNHAKNSQSESSSKIDIALERTAMEIHVGQFPIFCLTPQKPDHTRFMFQERLELDGVEVIKTWAIQVVDYYGWPGQHEADVWRSLQHIAELRARVGLLQNPFETTLDEIRQHMSHSSHGGKQWKDILRSLMCLHNTTIETNLWYNAADKINEIASFHLIDSLNVKHRNTDDKKKKIVERIVIRFGDAMFKNLSVNYVRPLDKGFRDQLGKWISQRLYEMLGLKFYGLRDKFIPYRTRYSRLCDLIGCKRQNHFSKAKYVLGKAHQELISKHFIEKVEWFEMNYEPHDWIIAYWPGDRAKSEWSRDYWRAFEDLIGPVIVEQFPPCEPYPAAVEQLVPDESSISSSIEFLPSPSKTVLSAPLSVPPSYASKPLPPPTIPPATPSIPETAHRTQDPKDSKPIAPKEFEDNTFIREVEAAFTRGTQQHRKLNRLSAAESACLAVWCADGVTPDDIEEGARAAVIMQRQRAISKGEEPLPIWSLAFIDGFVRDAQRNRLRAAEDARRATLLKNALRIALEWQSPAFKAEQALIHDGLMSMSTQIAKHIALNIALVESSSNAAVFLIQDESLLFGIPPKIWTDTLRKASQKSVEIISPVQWLERFV